MKISITNQKSSATLSLKKGSNSKGLKILVLSFSIFHFSDLVYFARDPTFFKASYTYRQNPIKISRNSSYFFFF